MTAINVFKSSDAVHIFSDGAFHLSGKLRGIGTKVHTIPEHNAVFGVTGLSVIPTLLAAQLTETQFPGLRSLADAMADLVKTCSARGKAVGHHLTGRCDVVLAGWSENAGALIHVVECHLDHNLFKGGAVERYIRPSVAGSADMRFPEDGLQLLAKQRAAKFSRPDAGTFGSVTVGGLVGGFAQHTQVGADGIRIKVLKRWPDEIE
ncbi:hypothetical protein CWO91_10270 [Bradyrhizobium genosp. SA-3]|uniref:hypothetical protein n=1 Tax=Bradyrhizobium genosp. SA-3 TaxID=508868 RepID=UPI001028C97D|nr:hypothetical protein [Bradyrhizobium genosp. SA-3]RZN11001.1 hypothetical protein CWO91_10270 [Bradyrhizobium genosp. SA-3]